MYNINNNVAVFIATHKKGVNLPTMPGYSIIQVNAKKNGEWDGCYHDDDGEDNISEKNSCYCELTALYSLWKNCDADIKGLVHYRRFLTNKENEEIQLVSPSYIPLAKLSGCYLSKEQIFSDLTSYDVILPARIWEYPFNIKEARLRVCYEKDMAILEKVIKSDFPEYLESYRDLLIKNDASLFNIMIAKKSVFDSYCQWIFAVLGKVEKLVDISQYDTFHKRIFGFMSEFLLDVYVQKNHLKAKHYEVVQISGPKSEMRRRNIKQIIKQSFVIRWLLPESYSYRKKKIQQLMLINHDKKISDQYLLVTTNLRKYYRNLGCINIKSQKNTPLNHYGISIAVGLNNHTYIYTLWFSMKVVKLDRDFYGILRSFIKESTAKDFYFYRFYLTKEQYCLVYCGWQMKDGHPSSAALPLQ